MTLVAGVGDQDLPGSNGASASSARPPVLASATVNGLGATERLVFNEKRGTLMTRRPEHQSSGRQVILDLATAAEMTDLIADEPGTADEALLDDALDAIEAGQTHLPTEAQLRARTGDAVAIELSPEAAEAIQTLIRVDTTTRPRLLRRIGDRLRHKVTRARRRRAIDHYDN